MFKSRADNFIPCLESVLHYVKQRDAFSFVADMFHSQCIKNRMDLTAVNNLAGFVYMAHVLPRAWLENVRRANTPAGVKYVLFYR
jgi:hypothetical protein